MVDRKLEMELERLGRMILWYREYIRLFDFFILFEGRGGLLLSNFIFPVRETVIYMLMN